MQTHTLTSRNTDLYKASGTSPPSIKCCSGCGDEKPLEDFHRSRSQSDGLQTYCKACSASYNAAWYADNQGYYAARRRAARQTWFAEVGGCRNCGSWDRLEVDHIIPRRVSGRPKIDWKWAAERLAAELAHCQPLCKSCHRIKSNAENTARALLPSLLAVEVKAS